MAFFHRIQLQIIRRSYSTPNQKKKKRKRNQHEEKKKMAESSSRRVRWYGLAAIVVIVIAQLPAPVSSFTSSSPALAAANAGAGVVSGVPSGNYNEQSRQTRHFLASIFAPTVTTTAATTTTTTTRLWASSTNTNTTTDDDVSILDLEEPAGVVGAEFFGGNKQKEEFYDPVAEAKAGDELRVDTAKRYQRFSDTIAFETPLVAQVAQELQHQINLATVGDKSSASNSNNNNVQYATSLSWESCFDTASNNNKNGSPLAGLKEARDFYKAIDVAIVSGKQLSDNRIQLQWQIAVVWPIFWEPRVLLTGFSELTLNIEDQQKGEEMSKVTITQQIDALDSSSDLISTVADQVKPRFWDMYHIGMTPSAEIMPRVARKMGLLPKSYNLFEIPARLVSAPSQLDSDAGRLDGNAQIVPNHAFSCVIKTMGPQKQEFVPASPVEVRIESSGKGNGAPPRLRWAVPLAVKFQTSAELPVPGEDEEARPNSEPECQYEFQPRRLVATVPYGGTPQDVEIANVRKSLYDAVTKDTLKPKLDGSGRPQFFFLQNTVKACSTEEGLGMCVYEWRNKGSKPNEVGIELEL